MDKIAWNHRRKIKQIPEGVMKALLSWNLNRLLKNNQAFTKQKKKGSISKTSSLTSMICPKLIEFMIKSEKSGGSQNHGVK